MTNSNQSIAVSGTTVFVNLCGLLGMCVSLLVAFYYQLVLSELPCPLCLLQRVGIILMGMGFLFNVQMGIKRAHYSMVILGCLVTAAIGIRQVFLHILPGDAGYGSAFLGLHFYTWSVLASVITLISVALMLVVDDKDLIKIQLPVFTGLNKAVTWLFVGLIAMNLVSTVLECGAGQCDDNPVFYQLLGK
ncbi:disulfide bond formation protein DsbB [Jezberella montanilacus]|jgi:disulfide bond formation protein DsbB|uniref:Disulfide bond formation protein DsbB n=1 Tax=Jezberella montanilacus TaxID=323426 RepID=A0A2T0XD37_9BURK|nr:disulfide bond formation protein B [Jezberella montanilacus]PRY96864.1 disulfide bond formation protein DsbB [Jezberella montanilacus]